MKGIIKMSSELGFPKKYSKNLPDNYVDTVEGMNVDEIKEKIVVCETNIYECSQAKDNDDELKKQKEVCKEMAASYKETKTIENSKLQFLLWTLEERGVDVNKK